ncbi:MAG: hypothetical protein MMC33_010832 [Icmadophila ericetorum]|nr:hypothetical protein [Icmadophila ericetorum]
MLLVAWEFGRKAIFDRLTSRLIMESKTNEEGQLLNSAEEKVREMVAMDINDRVLQIGAETIEKLAIALSEMRKQVFVRSRTVSLCKSKFSLSPYCDALVLGSYVAGCNRILPFPGDLPKTYFRSIHELITQILEIQFHPYYGPHHHAKCTLIWEMRDLLKYQDLIKTVFDEIPSAALDDHRLHLARQHDKLKLSIGNTVEPKWRATYLSHSGDILL